MARVTLGGSGLAPSPVTVPVPRSSSTLSVASNTTARSGLGTRDVTRDPAGPDHAPYLSSARDDSALPVESTYGRGPPPDDEVGAPSRAEGAEGR